jgi:hypothetical protein
VFSPRYNLRPKKHVTIQISRLSRDKHRKQYISPFTRYVQEKRYLSVNNRNKEIRYIAVYEIIAINKAEPKRPKKQLSV